MKNRAVYVIALGASMALAGCGGSAKHTSATVVKPVQSSSSMSSTSSSSSSSSSSTGALTSSGTTSSSTKVGVSDATVAAIQNAQIPADCQMPALRLAGGKTPANQMPKEGGPVEADGANGPLLLDVANKGSKQVLWRYNCTAGGVNWPEVLVLSDAQGNLVSSLDLGSISQSEHAQVNSWHIQGNSVAVSWVQYEGADFDKQTHQSVLSWADGKLVLKEQAGAAGAPRPGVPSGAAPGAGGPRPSNATPLTENDHSQYGAEPAFKSPSGHNGCQVMTGGGGSDIRCGTLSDDSGAELFMTADGQIENPTADDAPMWPQGDELAYGQVRYYGNTVFASTEQGVTVWNTQSGHGALINTSGVHQF